MNMYSQQPQVAPPAYGGYGAPLPNVPPMYNPYAAQLQRLQEAQAQIIAAQSQYQQAAQPVSPTMPPAQQATPASQQAQATTAQAHGTVLSVESEKQAREHPLDFSGVPILFTTADKSKVFMKRLDVSTGLSEFVVYTRETPLSQNAEDATSTDSSASSNGGLLMTAMGAASEKLNELKAEIITEIQNEFQNLKKDLKNGVKSNGNNKNAVCNKSTTESNLFSSTADGTGGE